MSSSKNITNTGALNYRDLQFLNSEAFMPTPEDLEFFNRVSQLKDQKRATYASHFNIAPEYIQSSLMQNGDGDYWGNSKFDEEVSRGVQSERLLNTRAENQPWYSKLAAGVTKGTILAGTTFADGTAGLIIGAINGIQQLADDDDKTGFWEGFWNNDFSKAMMEVNNWAETALPNYYTDEEQRNIDNGEWYKNIFTANWIGNSFIKNLGFTAGAIGTGSLVSGALKGAAPIVKGIVGSTIAGINESKIEALHTATDWEKAMTQKLDNARDEKLASLNIYRELYPEYYANEVLKIESDYKQSLAKIQEDKARVGNVALALNLPITMASDFITYGKIFAGSADDVFRVGNNIKRNNRVFENTMSPINIIGRRVAEGTQEISQKAAATISGLKYESELENFYSSRWNLEATKEVYDWSQAVTKGITSTLLDPNSWEEFTIGALTSAMGMPRIKSKIDAEGNSKKVLGWEGNIFQDIPNYIKEKKETDSRVQQLNERLNSPEFDNYYSGLIRHTKYQNDMSKAADINDEFSYRNAEDSQLFSDLIMFDKAGKLEDFTTIIKEVLDTSDANIESILKNLTNENGDSPFIENGNPLPKEEIVKKLNNRKESLLNQINTYRKAKRIVETQSKGNFSEEQVDTLTWLLSKIHRNQDRFNSLANDVRKPLITFLEHIKRTNPKQLETLDNIQNIINLDNESLGVTLSDPNNKKFVDTLSGLIEDFGLTYNLYEDYSTKIEDLQKLASLKEEYTSKFKEYFENPNKITQEQQRVESKKQVQKNITLQDNIDSKSVSEINKSLDDGEFDISELESITEELENVNPEELNSVQKKTKEALDIREKQKDIEKAIDKSNASEQTKEDAKKLLNNSKQQAESLEELLDLDSEAFLDSSTLLDEVSAEEFNSEELEELLAFRADQARGLLQEAISEEENVARELANMPIEEALEEISTETTGKDQVSTVEPINKKDTTTKNPLYEAFKEELNSEYGDSLRTLLQQIQTMAEQGFSNKEILETLKNSYIYNFKIPKEVRDKIDNYINSDLLNNINKEVTIEDKTSEESIDDVIDTSDESLLNNQKHKEDDTSTLRIGGILQAWLSPYTQYYRYAQKGDRKPFIDYAKESGKYTEDELKRIEAIYNYFINHNVFSNINNGAIEVGDKVTFFTDETLNNDAGDFVILMKSNGIVVGALPPIKLSPNYIGLSDFISEFKEAYEASDKGLEFTYGESEVMQNMVGRVPYDMEGLPLNSLNTIYQGNNFTLGISRSDGKNAKISIKAGRTRSFIPKASDPESRVLSPLDAKKGQPYLMIESSDSKRQYVPIPFIMPKYSVENTNSLLGQAINNVLEKLRTAKSSDTLKIKQELQELLSISEVYLEIKDGNVLMRIKPIGASKFTTILNSPQTEENIVEYAKKGLYGQPFQVSVKYINSTYKGQSYNNMIGEIAKTNLPIGEHHTIDDWFTIRPVGKKGVPIRTTKNNPNKAKPVLHEVTIGKDTYKVNLNTFDTYKLNNKGSYDLITDSSADVAKAIAYGYKTSTTEDIYKTEWGLFDSKSGKFVKEEIKETVPVKDNTQDLDTNVSNQLSLLEQAKNAKLLTTEKKRRVWEALNDNYKQRLLGYTGLKQKQMMEGLERAYRVKANDFDLSKLKGSLDSYFEISLYRKEKSSEALVSVDKEIKWLNAVLPQLATEDKLRLVEGLIKISKEDGGGFAWGQFKQGVIILPKVTAKGTVYHEAFHAVVHTLLTDSEVNKLFEAAKDKYGNLDVISLEESLAEDFRRYIQLNELDYNKTKLQRFIDNIFRTIKNIINKIKGKESYIDNLFYRINNGNYSSRISHTTTSSRYLDNSLEYNEILKNAPRDSEGRLLAPNGKPSNLTEKQYVQVRTKAFINWFGDWINDPQNASKVVDENGEPFVVYHGTTEKFTSFDSTKSKTKFDFTNHGIYFFTEHEVTARTYGEIIPSFLNIRNPFIYDFEGRSWLNDDWSGIGVQYGRTGEIIKLGFSSVNEAQEYLDKFLKEHPEYIDEEGYGLEVRTEMYLGKKGGTSDEIANEARANGYDGTIFNNIIDYKTYDDNQREALRTPHKTFTIFNPNQIKSATDNIGTFSTTENNIYLRNIELTTSRFQQIVDSVVNNATHTAKGRNDAWGHFTDTWLKDDIIIKGYKDKSGKYKVTSVTTKADEEKTHYRKVEQHYRDKYNLSNLSNEDLQYLHDRNISLSEYNRMSSFEKEVLFHCK